MRQGSGVLRYSPYLWHQGVVVAEVNIAWRGELVTVYCLHSSACDRSESVG
jgi:hypothetical protein